VSSLKAGNKRKGQWASAASKNLQVRQLAPDFVPFVLIRPAAAGFVVANFVLWWLSFILAFVRYRRTIASLNVEHMRDRLKSWCVTLAAWLILLPSLEAVELGELKVLYVGDTSTPRAREFEGFLNLNCGKVGMVNRKSFQQAQAKDYDVVLLDWPQSSRENGAEPTRKVSVLALSQIGLEKPPFQS
jgi:hypothetical protein